MRNVDLDTQSLLDRLEFGLSTMRPDYYAALQRGCQPEAFALFESQFPVRLPMPFQMLYQWRNGQRPECSASIQENMMYMPLESIVETKEMLDGMIGEDFESPDWWRAEWVPFLDNGGGDYLCLDLAGEAAGRVIKFYHDAAHRPVVSPDFATWLASLVVSLENGSLRSV